MRSVVQPAALRHHQQLRGKSTFSLALRDLTYAAWYAHIAGTTGVSVIHGVDRRESIAEDPRSVTETRSDLRAA
jgi:hypothetical protein